MEKKLDQTGLKTKQINNYMLLISFLATSSRNYSETSKNCFNLFIKNEIYTHKKKNLQLKSFYYYFLSQKEKNSFSLIFLHRFNTLSPEVKLLFTISLNISLYGNIQASRFDLAKSGLLILSSNIPHCCGFSAQNTNKTHLLGLWASLWL